MSDVYSLLNELSNTTGVSTFDAATSWKICTIVIAALGTIALFVFFTYLKKGKEKPSPLVVIHGASLVFSSRWYSSVSYTKLCLPVFALQKATPKTKF